MSAVSKSLFQSTPSSQKETSLFSNSSFADFNFNPLLLRGRRHHVITWYTFHDLISIHSFFAEGDGQDMDGHRLRYAFQSTPSSQKETACTLIQWRNSLNFNPLLLRRRRRITGKTFLILLCISIHSFFAEGDLDWYDGSKGHRIFQSTPSSQKETVLLLLSRGVQNVFQSTPSSQKETCYKLIILTPSCISIHSFFAEGDPYLWC